MNTNKEYSELSWISIILRVAMSSLFLVAGINKFATGLGYSAEQIMLSFSKTWLPGFLVAPYAYALPFVEIVLALWIFSGQYIKKAWITAAFVLTTLAFGMVVAGQHAIAASNYVYVVIACLGLYVSRYDCCDTSCKKIK
ncbi:MAG: hypothetical protein H6753_00450 [Candidatus Omnitrophica bacterium]|nr:hypothetical protein [Candidatus Omnitrophota bacterium]